MSQASELLAQLRGVQEPLPPDGVSLWLLTANTALLVLIIALAFLHRNASRQQWRRGLLRDLNKAKQLPPAPAVASAATMLRQLVLAHGHRAGKLTGEPWLQKLDEFFETYWFTQEQGRVFGDILYQPLKLDTKERDELLDTVSALIKRLPDKPTKAAPLP